LTGLPSSHHLAPPVSPRSAAATTALCFRFQISVTTHQQHQPQRHHPQCPHLQQRHRINRPLSSSDTTDTAGSKQNHEAPLRAPSPTVATTDHRRQGRQKQRLQKIINPTTSAPRNLPRLHQYPRHQPRHRHITTRDNICVSNHVSGFYHIIYHVILHCHITWSEILLPIEYHRSWYAFTLVNQDLALILFFYACP